MECPRQAECTTEFQREFKPEWRDDGSCSYCGSIKPEMVFDAIAAGLKLEPTDKNYKVYVTVPDPKVGQTREFGSTNAAECPGGGWVPGPGGSKTWVLYGKHDATEVRKFYFQHFSVDERKRFVALMNEKAIKLAAPGYFYRLPFFCI